MASVGERWWLPLPDTDRRDVAVREVGSADILPLRIRVLRAERPDLTAVYPLDDGPTTLHLAAVDEAENVVGTGTVYPEQPPAEVGDGALSWLRLVGMAVAPEVQGSGIGGLLLQVILGSADAAELPIWATARDSALAFYERHGFTTLPGGFWTASGIPHHHIVRFSQ